MTRTTDSTRLRRIAVVAAALAAGAVLATPAAQAGYPGRPGLIAYESVVDDCYARLRPVLVHAADTDCDPRREEIHTMTARGTHAKLRITGVDPAFSPDGKTLAFSGNEGNGSRIQGIDPVGDAQPRQLTAEES